MPELELNPFCALFPNPSDAEYASLRDSIRDHGLHRPIQLDADGRILDGRTRHRACRELLLVPWLETWRGPASAEAYMTYVADANLNRRHLSAAQRTALAAQLVKLAAAEGRSVTQTAAAAAMQVSQSSVSRAVRLSDDDLAAVAAGETGVPDAGRGAEDEIPGAAFDPFGNSLNAKMAAVWTSAASLRRAAAALVAQRKALDALKLIADPIMTYVDISSLRASINTAVWNLRHAVPYCVCPTCYGEGTGCRHCHEQGWMPRQYYETTTKEESRWPTTAG